MMAHIQCKCILYGSPIQGFVFKDPAVLFPISWARYKACPQCLLPAHLAVSLTLEILFTAALGRKNCSTTRSYQQQVISTIILQVPTALLEVQPVYQLEYQLVGQTHFSG